MSIDKSQCKISFFGSANLVERAMGQAKEIVNGIEEQQRLEKDMLTLTVPVKAHHITYLKLDKEFLQVLLYRTR